MERTELARLRGETILDADPIPVSKEPVLMCSIRELVNTGDSHRKHYT
jgi:hypothetical protein